MYEESRAQPARIHARMDTPDTFPHACVTVLCVCVCARAPAVSTLARLSILVLPPLRPKWEVTRHDDRSRFLIADLGADVLENGAEGTDRARGTKHGAALCAASPTLEEF